MDETNVLAALSSSNELKERVCVLPLFSAVFLGTNAKTILNKLLAELVNLNQSVGDSQGCSVYT